MRTLVSALTRITATLLLAIAIACLLPLAMAGGDTESRALSWVSGHASRLPMRPEEIEMYPSAYRLAIYDVSAPDTRLAVVRRHLDRLIEHGGLTSSQRTYVAELRKTLQAADLAVSGPVTPATQQLFDQAQARMGAAARLLGVERWSQTADRPSITAVPLGTSLEATRLMLGEALTRWATGDAQQNPSPYCNCSVFAGGKWDCADKKGSLKSCIPNPPNSALCRTVIPGSAGGLNLCDIYHQRSCDGMCNWWYPTDTCSDEWCQANMGWYYVIDPGTCQCVKYTSPLIVAADNQFDLTSPAEGVTFDLDADGAAELTGWTKANSSDAFLVLDRNHNGLIDDGSELFGNRTPLQNGQKASNGFEALVDLDGGTSSDGAITPEDASYSQLMLWTDRNHNGVSEPDELSTLAQAGVKAIYTSYQKVGRTDRYGNKLRLKGRVILERNGVEIPRAIYDVYLAGQ
jgi:hypothetical protein